ncbi:unnamed protein product [Lymnaea stagnalis]|uniref:Uncharacterized protein n=1 Tax=Lymnaea stagnalis TaxID=6523 RepID=A0AAV2HDM4_LYMST
MEYFIASEELIKHWAQACPNLSFIKFWVTRIVLPSSVVSCKAWQALANTHPNLLVEIHAQLIESTRQMLPILVTAMPVHTLKWDAWNEGTLEIDLKCLLHRVACYHRTIKILFVDVAGEFPNLDNFSVQKILANCKKLLPFFCYKTENDIRKASWKLAQK